MIRLDTGVYLRVESRIHGRLRECSSPSTTTSSISYPSWTYYLTIMNAGSSSHGLASLDDVIKHITTSNNASTLKAYLNSFAPKESRETILASTIGSGQDPLTLLDPSRNTLGYLYIL